MLIQFGRVVVATLIMTGCVLAFEQVWAAPGVDERLLLGVWLASTVVLASLTYILSARLLRITELDELISALKGRGRSAANASE